MSMSLGQRLAVAERDRFRDEIVRLRHELYDLYDILSEESDETGEHVEPTIVDVTDV